MIIYNKISNYYFIKQYVFVVYFKLSICLKSHKSSFRYFIYHVPISYIFAVFSFSHFFCFLTSQSENISGLLFPIVSGHGTK